MWSFIVVGFLFVINVSVHCFRNNYKRWRDDPVVKSTWYYSRGPKFGSQYASQEAHNWSSPRSMISAALSWSCRHLHTHTCTWRKEKALQSYQLSAYILSGVHAYSHPESAQPRLLSRKCNCVDTQRVGKANVPCICVAFYWTVKYSEVIFTGKCMSLEIIIVSEITQTLEGDILLVFFHKQNLDLKLYMYVIIKMTWYWKLLNFFLTFFSSVVSNGTDLILVNQCLLWL